MTFLFSPCAFAMVKDTSNNGSSNRFFFMLWSFLLLAVCFQYLDGIIVVELNAQWRLLSQTKFLTGLVP